MTIPQLYQHYGLSAGASGFGPRWGTYHWGVDFPTPVGVDIHTHIDCRLVLSGFYDTDKAGYIVMEALDGSCNWLVAHVSEVVFKPGTVVQAGTRVGKTGNSGNVQPRPTPADPNAGAHAHIEYDKGRFKGSIGANHNAGTTIDPLPIIKSLLGGHDEVTPIDNFKNCFITQAQRWPNADEIKWWQDSGLAPYEWVQKHGYHPMKEELEALKANTSTQIAALQKQITAANNTNAQLRANIQAEAQKLVSVEVDKLKDDAFKTAYRTQTGANPSGKTIDEWRRTDLSADAWVRKNVANSDVQHLQGLLDHANESLGSVNKVVDEQKKHLETMATELMAVQQSQKEVSQKLGDLETMLTTERQTSEGLRTKLTVAEAQAKPVDQLGVVQLLSALLSRLTGGA